MIISWIWFIDWLYTHCINYLCLGLKVQLEDQVNKKEEENAELKMEIQTTKKELRNFKEQETKRAKQLKTALETYISGVGLS